MARIADITRQPDRRFDIDGHRVVVAGFVNRTFSHAAVMVFVDGRMDSPITCEPNDAAVIAAMDEAERAAQAAKEE